MENELRLKHQKKNNIIFGFSIVLAIYMLAMLVYNVMQLVMMFSHQVPLPNYPGLNYYVVFFNIVMAIIVMLGIYKQVKLHRKGEPSWNPSMFVNTIIMGLTNFAASILLYDFTPLGGQIPHIVMVVVAIAGLVVYLKRIKVAVTEPTVA